jgi:hypothetical protein
MANNVVIAADPGKMREFLININTDVNFRKSFLKEPIVVLKKNGFTLNPEAEEQIEAVVMGYQKDVKGIALLPTGYDKFLGCMGYKGKKVSKGKVVKHSKKDDVPMGLV